MFISNMLTDEYEAFKLSGDICARHYANSLGVINAAPIVFAVTGTFSSFTTGVALADGSSATASANFSVYADGRLVDCIMNVKGSDHIQYLEIGVENVDEIKLVVESKGDATCFPVWVSPQCHTEPILKIRCPFNNIEASMPSTPIIADKCIYTVLTNGREEYFDTMIKSLKSHGRYPSTVFVVLGFDLDPSASDFVKRNDGILINCRVIDSIKNTSCKTIAYAISRLVRAEKYLYLDSDMLVMSDINPIFDMLDFLEDGTILAARHGDKGKVSTLKDALIAKSNFESTDVEIESLRLSPSELNYRNIVNSGLFVGSARALASVHHCLKTFMPAGKTWLGTETKYNVREEGLFIAALARLNCCVVLDESYNFQAHFYADDLMQKINVVDGMLYYENKLVNVLHFTGQTKPYFYIKILGVINDSSR